MARNKGGTTYIVRWGGRKVVEEGVRQIERNAERVGMFLSGKVVRSISKGQPFKRVGNRMVGLNPSKPGRPPHVLHGVLRASIDHKVRRKGKDIEIAIGAHTPYARRLEYGDVSFSAGRLGAGFMHARPYLRPALKKNRDKAIKMLFKDVFPKKIVRGGRRRS